MNGKTAGKTAGKARGKAPVSSHPLFPAIVALWFGAAFGLGSLAIRASLLESAVLAMRLDLLVPAAAPPLGLTARILLALVLAVIGSAIGAMLARWIARPRPVVVQRRRAPVAQAEADASPVRARDAHSDAPARRPISAHDEFGDAGESEGIDPARDDAAAPARRRALSIEADYQPSYHHELAPLPGGGSPQILDINAIIPPAPLLLEDEPLDRDDSGDIAEVLGFDRHAPFSRAPLVESLAEPLPEVAEAESRAEIADEAPAPRLFAAPADAQRPFAAPAPISRLFAGPAADDDHADIPAFAAPQPLFAAAAPDDDIVDEAPAFVAEVAEPIAPEPAVEPEPAAPAFAPPPRGLGYPAAVNPVEAAPLAELGQVELIERLALAMQKRRARADIPPVPDFAAALGLSPADLMPEAPIEAEIPAAMAPEAQPAPAEPVVPVSVAPAFEAPAFTVPAFDVPAFEATPAPAVFAAPEMPSAPLAMPAALRPIIFADDIADDLGSELDDILPPRRFANPVAAEADDDDEDEDAAYSSLLDLPRNVPAKQPFIRIEEAEAAIDTIEPVVIFPGQAARAPFAAPAPQVAMVPPMPVAESVSEPTVLRRFDAPGSAVGAGQAVSAPPVSLADPEETERALRSALATLQRMSGAA